MPDANDDPDPTDELLRRAAGGETRARERLLERHRDEVRNFVEVHLDPRLRARLDPSDVVQEAYLEASRRLDDYLKRRPMPFGLWLRKTAYERLLNLRRDHRAARRAVQREAAAPDRSSLLLVQPLLARGPSPSEQVLARELAERVGRAVGELSEADREILLMRHVEQLPYDEVACLLEIEPAAARKRYGRSLLRLRAVLHKHGLLESQS